MVEIKYVIIVAVVIIGLILFLNGCKTTLEPYYQSDDCNCTSKYYCVKGYVLSKNYCVRMRGYWKDSDGYLRPDGDGDFENDILKCNQSITVRKHNYSCWDTRQIIELKLDVAPREIRTVKVCNYEAYSKDITQKEGDWNDVYLEECIGVK